MHLAFLLAALTLLLIPVYYALASALAGWLTPIQEPDRTTEPSGVTALIPFVHEANLLENTVRAFLDSEGSFAKQVWLLGDNPSEEAEEVAHSLAQDPRVQLKVWRRAWGKASVQAWGAKAALHPILLCLDAGTRVAPDAALRLTAPLQDPAVAYTTGKLVYEQEASLETSYWSLEQYIKRYQSQAGGLFGAAGGLFACRKSQYIACPTWCMLDLVLPCLLERIHGGVGRYVETAVGKEPGRTDSPAWLRARIRIQARSIASLVLLRGWLSGVSFSRALGFLCYKFLRWHGALSLVLVLLLLASGPTPLRFLAHGLTGFLVFSALLAAHYGTQGPLGLLATPGYAVGVQLAGWSKALSGRSPSSWKP